jgi:hypothetical protein
LPGGSDKIQEKPVRIVCVTVRIQAEHMLNTLYEPVRSQIFDDFINYGLSYKTK